MNAELMEDEMRRALFGDSEPSAPAINSDVQDTVPDIAVSYTHLTLPTTPYV